MTKRAIGTGAAGGMGIVTAARLSRDGFEVVALDINETGLAEAKAGAHGDVHTYHTDLTDESAVRSTVGRFQHDTAPWTH